MHRRVKSISAVAGRPSLLSLSGSEGMFSQEESTEAELEIESLIVPEVARMHGEFIAKRGSHARGSNTVG